MIKKIIRLGTLLTIKESYLFSKNIYGLGVHPLKTLGSLSREKDRSQQLLILAIPVFGLAAGMVMFGWWAKFFYLLTAVSAAYLLFYWTRIWSRR
ncbi:MAG: hypothetical protein V1810_00785 [Candidatus Beckwithbacteria bacterium]